MGFFPVISIFAAQFGDVIFDAFFGFLDWLKVNDFSGTRRRKALVQGAPGSFHEDGLPVVLGADDRASLLYRDGRFVLQHRKTRNTAPVTRKGLRRFTRRGMKGLRSQTLTLAHRPTPPNQKPSS